MKKTRIIVTGDYSRDRFIYVEGISDEPVNLREAWIADNRFWVIELRGSSALLVEYLKATGLEAYDPFKPSEDMAESIFILTRQGEGANRKWRVGQAITAGLGQYPSYRITLDIKGISPQSPPAVLIDYYYGWLDANQEVLADFLKERPYVVRTDDPRKPAWVEVRKKGVFPGIWFSPIQDMAGGGLWFAGNWEDMRRRLVEYFQQDNTLWDNRWLHHIVVQISYDGALILGPGINTQGTLLFFAGDQPGSFSRRGYGAVTGGGTVFVASLVNALLTKTPVESTILRQCVREGLARARLVIQEGYIGPEIGATDWRPTESTNLAVSSLRNPQTNDIATYPLRPPKADWQAACDIVCGDTDTLRRRAFHLGDLIIVSPDYARTLLRLASRLEAHLKGNRGILSLTIFGGPGSGKSFAAQQLARVIDPAAKILKELQFNISQLGNAERLVDALHQIQTTSLQGKVPFVLWDEFDSSLEGNRAGWLRYFLMPMQDAKFFDGTRDRDLGKCVFVFIGGTFEDEKEFKKWALDTDEGKKQKGPDFHSRLDSYLTVPSVDLTVSQEEALTKSDLGKLNRAIVIRNSLRKQEKVKAIAPAVLAYLLHVPLMHGARSLDRIIIASDLQRASTFQLFHMPPMDVLELHVRTPIANVGEPVIGFLRNMGCEKLLLESPLPLKWKNE